MKKHQHKNNPEISNERISHTALKIFFRISKLWKLDDKEQMVLLGTLPRSTFYKWKKDLKAKLSHDTLERISYIIGIYKALQLLLPNDAADKWIKKPNLATLFNGKSALDRMLSGNVADLYTVRQYLDAQRGGWA